MNANVSARSMSIIVAIAVSPRRATAECAAWLQALRREAKEVGAEILVVGSPSEVGDAIGTGFGEDDVVRSIPVSASALIPVRWSVGLAASRGDIVALTISQCTVPIGWARAAINGLEAGFAGVGGRLTLAPDATTVERAVFYLRYAGLLRRDGEGPQEVHDIAGDNAAYWCHHLRPFAESYAHGFWEVETHHLMRAAGARFALVGGMSATFAGAPPLRTFVRQRFEHGAHFGAWRVRSGRQGRWRIVVAAPLVPFVLFLRASRAATRAGDRAVLVLSSAGAFLLLAAAWALGEAVGAVAAASPRAQVAT